MSLLTRLFARFFSFFFVFSFHILISIPRSRSQSQQSSVLSLGYKCFVASLILFGLLSSLFSFFLFFLLVLFLLLFSSTPTLLIRCIYRYVFIRNRGILVAPCNIRIYVYICIIKMWGSKSSANKYLGILPSFRHCINHY